VCQRALLPPLPARPLLHYRQITFPSPFQAGTSWADEVDEEQNPQQQQQKPAADSDDDGPPPGFEAPKPTASNGAADAGAEAAAAALAGVKVCSLLPLVLFPDALAPASSALVAVRPVTLPSVLTLPFRMQRPCSVASSAALCPLPAFFCF
jgi:hypothetical protein